MRKNKKIAFFIPSLRGGGAERVFVNLANEFSKRDFDVDLVLVQKEGPYLKEVNKNVNIVDLKSKRIIFSLSPLVKYLRKEKLSCVLSTLTHANIIVILAKILSQTKAKIMIRQAIHFSSSKNKKLKLLAKFFYKKADKIIVISEEMKNDLLESIRLSKEKVALIYNPVFNDIIKKKKNETITHKWLKTNEYKVILGTGRLTQQKGFSILIKAFAILRKKEKIKLIILGEGKERKNLENLIKKLNLENDVDMPGFVDNPYAYIAKTNVYVLSSLYEGFPNTLVEALACSTPVVSTDCPSGPSEILDSRKYGELVPIGDINALVRAIEKVLDNPTEKELLQKRAMDFDIKKIADDYIKVITENE